MKTAENTFAFEAPEGIVLTPEETLRGMFAYTDKTGALCLPAWLFDEDDQDTYYEVTMKWDAEDLEQCIAAVTADVENMRKISAAFPQLASPDADETTVAQAIMNGGNIGDEEINFFGLLFADTVGQNVLASWSVRGRAVRVMRLFAMEHAPKLIVANELMTYTAMTAIKRYGKGICFAGE